MLHHHTFSRDSISFQKAPVNSFNCMFANTVYSLGNPIITFLLSFCLSAILSFWKGPFRDRGPFYLILKGFKPAPPLLNGWEQTGLGFLWVTQLAMERPGPASFTFSLCLMASQPHDFIHTHYHPIAMQNSSFFSSPAPSHIAAWKRSPSLVLLCPTATNACNFCANEERRLWANTPLSAWAIIGFGPYGGRKICNCGPLGKQWERQGWREAVWEGCKVWAIPFKIESQRKTGIHHTQLKKELPDLVFMKMSLKNENTTSPLLPTPEWYYVLCKKWERKLREKHFSLSSNWIWSFIELFPCYRSISDCLLFS